MICEAKNKNGSPCKNKAKPDRNFCDVHSIKEKSVTESTEKEICDAPEVFRRLGFPVVLIITLSIGVMYVLHVVGEFSPTVTNGNFSFQLRDAFSTSDTVIGIIVFSGTMWGGFFSLEKLDCYFFNYNKSIESYRKGVKIEEYVVWVKVIIVGLIAGAIVSSIIGGFTGFVVGVVVGIIAGVASEVNRSPL